MRIIISSVCTKVTLSKPGALEKTKKTSLHLTKNSLERNKMNYSIGEVAKLTNLSRDMIRYYEKQGAIKASRNIENNYRTYDTMEVFWLFEAIQH